MVFVNLGPCGCVLIRERSMRISLYILRTCMCICMYMYIHVYIYMYVGFNVGMCIVHVCTYIVFPVFLSSFMQDAAYEEAVKIPGY